MAKVFDLNTLKIGMADPSLKNLDLNLQIQRTFRHLILNNLLAPGSRLPATRTLAKSLGLSRDTVETAYIQLQCDGYIRRREGAGSFVADNIGPELRGASRKRSTAPVIQQALRQTGGEISGRGAQILASGGVVDRQNMKAFACGMPDTRIFPHPVWDRMQRQAIKDYRSVGLTHGDPQGLKDLRESIAEYLNLERGANVSAERVLIMSGTRQALFICAQVLADVGSAIVMEEPGYHGARKAFESAQLRIVPIPVDEYGLRTDALRADTSDARVVYVTPSHQYPTGVTLSLERRLALIDWAHRHQGWIIEDDYDSEFHYQGLPTACVQGLDHFQRTIYLGTFSKTMYPGVRVSYMVLPPELIETMTCARSVLDGYTPQLMQFALARFMAAGHYASHIRSMRKIYAARRSAMIDAIDKHLSDIVNARVAAGGMQIPCLLKAGWSEAETMRIAAEAGIPLSGISRLYYSQAMAQGWLLGFAALTPYEIESAIQRLASVLNKPHAAQKCCPL